MAVSEIRVSFEGQDPLGEQVKAEAEETYGVTGIDQVRTSAVYRLEGVTPEQAQFLAEHLFMDPINQRYEMSSGQDNLLLVAEPTERAWLEADDSFAQLHEGVTYSVDVGYQPGVMVPQAETIIKAARDLGIEVAAADQSVQYDFIGDVDQADLQRLVDEELVNKTVQHVIVETPETLLIEGETGPVETIPIREMGDAALEQLSTERSLHLNLPELQAIREYARHIGRDLTDCEVEIIAARWSEHCGHKTFKAEILLNGERKEPLMRRIMDTAKRHFGDKVLSAFNDNSGVLRFAKGWAISGKVETHNSPSALEPYGGAATGTGGVLRDIIGTGQGAEVILSTDMFCFAPPRMPAEKLPPGTLNQDYLYRKVVAGVRDYGNRMGVPTANGSVHFHEDFRAKPSVIVGAYGLMPEKYAAQGHPGIGDKVVAIGGRTGRDGIHGATFSSGEMTAETAQINSTAVQIGNPIEEKRFADAILEARDAGLIRAITDCGAAGFSSAVGEMGEDTGVSVDISQAPLKYPGLAPWEIWLSESQERMVLAVSPEDVDAFEAICHKYRVESTVLGEFTDTRRLQVYHGDEVVADLDYDFLDNGMPERVMTAEYTATDRPEVLFSEPQDWRETFKQVLAHPNVCSKEPIVRQYDHSVQGRAVNAPYDGADQSGPNDATVLAPLRGEREGFVASHGMNPILNRLDPYHGTRWALVEGAANYVAVGGDLRHSAIVGNYISAAPDAETMGALDQMTEAACDFMDELEIPVISGKDSLSSTYRNKDTGEVIKIPPVYCASFFGKIESVEQTVTSSLKNPGSVLVVVGAADDKLGGSAYHDARGIDGGGVPEVDLATFRTVAAKVHQGIAEAKISACHDVSEGGVATAVAEMAFGSRMGVELDLGDEVRPDRYLFNETPGRFVIEMEDAYAARELFHGVPYEVIGVTKADDDFRVYADDLTLVDAPVSELKAAWQAPTKEVFGDR